MPFMFDLELPALTTDIGVAIEHAVADAGAWPVRFTPGREERRWFGIRKAYPTVLEVLTADGQGHVLQRPDHWDEVSWKLRPDALPRLVALIDILARISPAGFTFRATWAGSPIERTIELPATKLATLVSAQQLNDHTRYVIPAPE